MTRFVDNSGVNNPAQTAPNNATFGQPQRSIIGRILDRAPMWLLVILAFTAAAQIILPEEYTPAYIWGRVDGTTESGSQDASRKARVTTEDALTDVQTAYQIKLQREVIKLNEEKDIAVAIATAKVQEEKDIAVALNQEASQRARERQQAINEAQKLAQQERIRQVEATSGVKVLGVLVGDTACELRGFLGSDFGGCKYAEVKRNELEELADDSLETYEDNTPVDGTDIADPSQVVVGEELQKSHGRYRDTPDVDTSTEEQTRDGGKDSEQ